MAIVKLTCDRCDFETEETSVTYFYTVVGAAEIILGQPAGASVLKRVTGLEWNDARARGLIHSKHYCICYGCAGRFYLDIDRNEKRCPVCSSSDVRTFSDAIAKTCPACHAGTLTLIAIGIT